VIAIGFKGMQLEQQAERIGRVVAGLRVNFDRFKRDVELISTHLERARTKLDETQRDIRRLDDTVSTLELGERTDTEQTDAETRGRGDTGNGIRAEGEIERLGDPEN
jgi:DNA anti-recombination protein RmuC